MAKALIIESIGGPAGPVHRAWAAACDRATDFSLLASIRSGIGIAQFGGTTTMHLRGPGTTATTLSCPTGAEYFGVEFRLGAYLPMFPPARLVNMQDAILPTLSDGRVLLNNQAWEMPTPQNIDVFVDRLARAGLLAFDPLVDELLHGGIARKMPARTARSRFLRAVGLSRRDLYIIERARRAADLLTSGRSIEQVIHDAGYYDQPHLTRSLRRLIGHTPAELVQVGQFLDL